MLQSIDGVPLPAPYTQNTALTNRMFADTLILGVGGKGQWRAVVEDSYGGAKRRDVENFTYSGTTHIEIEFYCPDVASCIAPPHLAGDVTSNGIVFTISRVTRAPLVFERVPPGV